MDSFNEYAPLILNYYRNQGKLKRFTGKSSREIFQGIKSELNENKFGA